jgi:hypothetical protein
MTPSGELRHEDVEAAGVRAAMRVVGKSVELVVPAT